MLTDQEISTLKESHKPGKKGLLFNYSFDIFLKSAKWPFYFALPITLLLLFSKISYYKFLSDILDIIISVIPNLLGFILGGYALMIGFGNIEFLKRTTKPSKKDGISLFQRINSIFTFCILALVITLLLSIIIRLVAKFDLIGITNIFVINSINLSGIFLILFSLFYSILLLPDMVFNIFNFAQAHHLFLSKQRLIDEKKAPADKISEGNIDSE